MSVHDAEPQDVYADKNGKLWRVYYYCSQPTVGVIEIEPAEGCEPARMSGGISGLMWNGFTRIFRPAP